MRSSARAAVLAAMVAMAMAGPASAGTVEDAYPDAPPTKGQSGNGSYRYDAPTATSRVELDPNSFDANPGDAVWADFTVPVSNFPMADGRVAEFTVDLPATVLGSSWGVKVCTKASPEDASPCGAASPVLYHQQSPVHNVFTVPVGGEDRIIRVQLTFLRDRTVDSRFTRQAMLRFRHRWLVTDNTPPTFGFKANGVDVASAPSFNPSTAPDGVTLDMIEPTDGTAVTSASITVDGVTTPVSPEEGGSLQLTPGRHSVVARATDAAGNTREVPGTVEYAVPPLSITGGTPGNGARLRSGTKLDEITAATTGPELVSGEVKLDGNLLPTAVDISSLAATVPEEYELCVGRHTVDVAAKDSFGQVATASWTFRVNGKPTRSCARKVCVDSRANAKNTAAAIRAAKAAERTLVKQRRGKRGQERRAINNQLRLVRQDIKAKRRLLSKQQSYTRRMCRLARG